MSDCRRSLASRVLQGVTSNKVLQGVTSRVDKATKVQWEELRRLPKHLSSSSVTIGSEVIFKNTFNR